MNLLSALLSLSSPARSRVGAKSAGPASRATALLLAVIVLATACGSSGIQVAETRPETPEERPTIPAVEPTAVPPADETPEDTGDDDPQGDEPVEDPVPAGRIDSVQGVAAATVKIIAEGVFVPPFELDENRVAGIGTGFIIDPTGLMVTNNHVVTGSAFVEVYLDGSAEATNARLLGVSECNDLAVLDLDGDGYEWLDFRTNMDGVNPGLPVFAAGYPANFDRDFLAVDYTLTGGIVSTTQASGALPWSSVDNVIEHDARIRGGNSGGPLVDEGGRVVGINYAGEDVNDLNLAIAAFEAWPVIEALQQGDVESLGINGRAVVDGQISGIWVSGVESGSPADQAGLIAGDLIITMEGLPMASDGTMEDYCDIIRTNGPEDTLSIEVVRLGTEEVLEGQINGTPLAQSFSFAEELADEMAPSDGTASPDAVAGYSDYEFVSDDSNSVGVEVPVEWVQRDGSPNPEFGESIYASPDIESFLDTWDVPGVIVERSTDLTSADIDGILDAWNLDCANRGGREAFETGDGVFVGKWEVFTECGGTDTAALTIAVSPADGGSVVRMYFQIVTEADLEAADRAIASFDSVS